MQESEYPSKDALSSVLDAYLDAMRGFVVRCLRRIAGRRVEDAVAEALNDRRRDEFTRNLGRGESAEGAIEIRDLPTSRQLRGRCVHVGLRGPLPEHPVRRTPSIDRFCW